MPDTPVMGSRYRKQHDDGPCVKPSLDYFDCRPPPCFPRWKEPSHLHIVLSGTCTVTKYPDRLAAVQRKVNEIGAALYRIKSKYTYHRDVRAKVVSDHSICERICDHARPGLDMGRVSC